MAWRTRSSRRGFGGSGGPLSWHAHGTRPPAGSVEWWPRGLASRMAMSWRATYGIGTRPRKAPNRIHRTDSIARGPDGGRLPKEADNRRSSWRTSDHDFEAELERPIRLQVVAGPRNHRNRPPKRLRLLDRSIRPRDLQPAGFRHGAMRLAVGR